MKIQLPGQSYPTPKQPHGGRNFKTGGPQCVNNATMNLVTGALDPVFGTFLSQTPLKNNLVADVVSKSLAGGIGMAGGEDAAVNNKQGDGSFV